MGVIFKEELQTLLVEHAQGMEDTYWRWDQLISTLTGHFEAVDLLSRQIGMLLAEWMMYISE